MYNLSLIEQLAQVSMAKIVMFHSLYLLGPEPDSNVFVVGQQVDDLGAVREIAARESKTVVDGNGFVVRLC